MKTLSFSRIGLLILAVSTIIVSCDPEDLPPNEGPNNPPPPPPPGTATLTTTDVTAITINSAASGGNITADGGAAVTARGVCWGTSTLPTTAGSKTTDGTGTGVFTSNITGLVSGTTYYLRAYATNSAGTSYGSEKTFTTTIPTPAGNVTDIDGNVYETITIGNQVWMKTNLKVTKYNDGSPIPEKQSAAFSPDAWNIATEGAWCHYDNSAANGTTYGKLYNFLAVNTGKLAPAGWRVPTLQDVLTLYETLGTYTVAGAKIKSTTNHWQTPQPATNNSSGFTALPGGGRGYNLGVFGSIGTQATFWTSTIKEAGSSYWFGASHNVDQADLNYTNQRDGLSVRCIKN